MSSNLGTYALAFGTPLIVASTPYLHHIPELIGNVCAAITSKFIPPSAMNTPRTEGCYGCDGVDPSEDHNHHEGGGDPHSTTAAHGPVTPKILCFDFDESITHHHTHGVQLESNLTREHCLRNFSDARFFAELCHVCDQKGHYLRIASYADSEFEVRHSASHGGAPSRGGSRLVSTYLDALLGSDRTILLEHEMECWYQSDSKRGKNEHLENIYHTLATSAAEGDKETIPPPHDIILIDDDENNIRRALEAGYMAFHCTSGIHRNWFLEQSELCSALGVSKTDFS
eukprot:PhF_6_TR14225/c0_g1_i1/m.22808